MDCDDNAEEWTEGADCAPSDPAIHAGASDDIPPFIGDGVDQNCDGMETCYADSDNDGEADAAGGTIYSADLDCTDPGESASTGLDCDDSDPSVYTGASEVTADGVDQNCNGLESCYKDDDGDTFAGSNTAEIDAVGGEMQLTPNTGTHEGPTKPGWGNKGYRFTTLTEFSIDGVAWLMTLPVGGYVEAKVYDTTGTVLATGTQTFGDGTEQWYRSDINFDFASGVEYTIDLYTNRADSALMYRRDSPTYGYSLNGLVTDLTHYSSGQSGDDCPDAIVVGSRPFTGVESQLGFSLLFIRPMAGKAVV